MIHVRRTFRTVVAVFALLAATSLAAQLPTARLTGTLVDESGEPVIGVELLFTPDKTAALQPRTLKVNKKGNFAHSFFPSGTYTVTLQGGADGYLKSMSFIVKDSANLDVESKSADAHPKDGLPAMTIPAGHRVTLDLVLGTSAERARLDQEVAILDFSGPLKKMGELYDAGDFQAVVVEADKVLGEKPDLGHAHYMRGFAMWKLGSHDEAEVSLGRALELMPDRTDIHGVLGSALIAKGDTLRDAGKADEAVATYSNAADHLAKDVEANSESVASLKNLAGALDRAGRQQELAPVLAAILEQEPGDVQLAVKLAQIHTEAGRTDEAMAVLDGLSSKDGDAATALYNVAVKLFNDQEVEGAAMAVSRALQVDPELADGHKLLAFARLQQSDHAGAAESLGRYLELAPDAPDAAQQRQLMEALRQQAQKP